MAVNFWDLEGEPRVRDIVFIKEQDAYGRETKRAGKVGYVVSTSAGIVPGLVAWVAFSERACKNWHDFIKDCSYYYYGALEIVAFTKRAETKTVWRTP